VDPRGGSRQLSALGERKTPLPQPLGSGIVEEVEEEVMRRAVPHSEEAMRGMAPRGRTRDKNEPGGYYSKFIASLIFPYRSKTSIKKN
jgi:hypothetical protein